jgi:hypothetical protein
MHEPISAASSNGREMRDRLQVTAYFLRIHSRHSLALAGAAAVALAARPARAESPPRVGVIVALTVNVPDEEAVDIAARLGDALRAELVVDVIAGAEVARRLPPSGLPTDCVARPECVGDVARRVDSGSCCFWSSWGWAAAPRST